MTRKITSTHGTCTALCVLVTGIAFMTLGYTCTYVAKSFTQTANIFSRRQDGKTDSFLESYKRLLTLRSGCQYYIDEKEYESKIKLKISKINSTEAGHENRLWNLNVPLDEKRYLDPPGPVTALASFPGSGNTWTRHLLEELSGN